jgi:hypothetical protein
MNSLTDVLRDLNRTAAIVTQTTSKEKLRLVFVKGSAQPFQHHLDLLGQDGHIYASIDIPSHVGFSTITKMIIAMSLNALILLEIEEKIFYLGARNGRVRAVQSRRM